MGHGLDAEIARLRAQVAMSWSVESRRLASLGVADGQHLLEVGCGPGFVTERLASWLPASRIVAVDSDPRMLSQASRLLAGTPAADRVTFLHRPAHDTGLPSDTFDLALSRYLMQHLPDPVSAAAEALRVLRPGGVHVVIDVDDGLWGLVQPEFPEFRNWHAWRARAQAGRGGDRFVGRRLGRVLRQAGYVGIDLDVFAYHSDDAGLEAFAPQLYPGQFLPLVEGGLMTVEEYARACVATQRFFASSAPFLLMVGFIARAEKPHGQATPP
jgi:SAM-dependent methyltransferase